MDTNTLLSKLDNVLIYLENQRPSSVKSINEIAKDLNSLTNENELLLILNKLISDGYVQFEDRQMGYEDEEGEYFVNVRHYIITFDGRFFILTAGYVKQNEIKLYDSTRLNLLAADQIKRDKINKNLTIWIAIATCIAGVYYLIEIFKEIRSFF